MGRWWRQSDDHKYGRYPWKAMIKMFDAGRREFQKIVLDALHRNPVTDDAWDDPYMFPLIGESPKDLPGVRCVARSAGPGR